jgi:hypothetical protein
MATRREELIKLYELTIDEHHFYLEAHHKRIDFYSGLLLALLTGTAVGLFQASEWYHYAYLCLVPILIFALSGIAIQGTGRVYQGLLESITVRAKVEQELGFATSQPRSKDCPQSYWEMEPLVPKRHIESRRKSKSSQAFITEHLAKGLQKWAGCLFRVFQVLSVALFIFLVSLAIWNCIDC